MTGAVMAVGVMGRGGGGGLLDTQTVTIGESGTDPNLKIGFRTSPALGSIVDGTSNIYSGAAITALYWDQSFSDLYLTITGAANTGWTTMTVGSTEFARASASFSSGAWTWAGAPYSFTAITVVKFD